MVESMVNNPKYCERDTTKVTRDFTDGSKLTGCKGGWSVFFATMNKNGWDETKPVAKLALNPEDVAPITPKVFATPQFGLLITMDHAILIHKGKKKAIVKTINLSKHIDEWVYLLSDGLCFGEIKLKEPVDIHNQKEFEGYYNEHLITNIEKDKWANKEPSWDKFPLYLYKFEYRGYDKPKPVKLKEKGAQVFVSSDNIQFLNLKDLSFQDLEYYHAFAHSNFEELGDIICKLHFDIASEMIDRGTVHFNRSLCDSIVELIHQWKTYDPSKIDDRVLRDDWRICKAWLSTLKNTKKPFSSPQFEGMNLEEQISAIKKMARSIRSEMIKRGWHPSELFKIPEQFNISDIDVPYIEKLSDKDLGSLWKWLHEKWSKEEDPKVPEDYLNVNIFIQTERWKRGLIDVDYKDKDKLDEESRMGWQEYGIPSNPLSEPESEIELNSVIEALRKIGMIPIKGQPYAGYLVGRIVNEGKIPKDHDLDIIFRQKPDPRLILAIKNIQPKWIADKIHIVFDPYGPGIGYSVPLWGYALNPLPKELNIKGFGPSRDLSNEVKLFRYIVGLKPKSGFGTNEFWDIDDMWNKWGSHYIDKGIVVQEKVDGRRMQGHVSGDKIEIITEDTQRNRADAFPEIEAELKKLKYKDVILDGEFLAYDYSGKEIKGSARHKREIGELVPREDTAVITTGTPQPDFRKLLIYVIYDIMYTSDDPNLVNKPYPERYKKLQECIPSTLQYIDIVRGTDAHNKVQFYSAVDKMRHLNGSEGVVCKAMDSIYPVKYSGENRASDWAKIKNLKEAEFIVLGSVQKKTEEGKPLNTWMYICGFEIPKNKIDEFSKERIKEYKGKYYQIIGKAYGTSQRASTGEIVTVMPIRIREYKDKEDKRYMTWMFPFFKEVRKNKTEPDTLTTIERIAAVGTAPLSDELSEVDILMKLELCKFYKDPEVCPLWKRHYPDVTRYQLATIEEEVLKYPVMCPLANHFKCRYLKSYYYETVKINYHPELNIDDVEPDEFIDYFKLPHKAWIELQAKYMECPAGEHDYVMQQHQRGESQHLDFRMKVNGYLVGWTIAGGSMQVPITPQYIQDRKNIEQHKMGFVAEEKARQPSGWLKVGGEVKPGQGGAGVEVPGIFKILSTGKVIFGAQKCFVGNTKIIVQDKNGRIRRSDISQVIERREKVKILTPSGFKNIVHYIKKPVGLNKLLRITMENGDSFIVDEEHPSIVHKTTGDIKVPSKELIIGDLLPFGSGYESEGRGNFDLGMLIGLYLAEGSIISSTMVSFALNKTEIKLKDLIIVEGMKLGASYRIDKNSKNNGVSIVLVEAGGVVGLFEQFINKDKSLKTCAFALSKECRKGIIRGVTEGDGTDYSSYSVIEMGSLHKSLMFDLKDLCMSTGNICSIRRLKGRIKLSHSLNNFTKGNWHQYLLNGNIYIKIKKIEDSFKNRNKIFWVYDFELENDHRIQLANGLITSNTYFHEYFVKGKDFPDWTRIIVRMINIATFEPGTKIKSKFKEPMWRLLVADPEPYTISNRAMQKPWKPPKSNPTPFPMPWTKTKFPEQYAKWETWMEGKLNELSSIQYTYSQHSFRGPKHIRNMWIRSYYLFLKDTEGPVRTFRMDDFAPMSETVSAIDEGRDPSKVMTFEGPTQPRSRFNPNNKELKGEMKILSKGSVVYDPKDIDGKEVISLSFSSGLLKGHWTLEQEEKGSDVFTFSIEGLSENTNGRFVYQKHCIGTECHNDIRYQKDGSSRIDEFNLYGDITKDNVKAIKKECWDESWMNINEPDTIKKVGGLETKVSPIDSGRIEIIEDNVDFSSYKLYGKKLRGLFISKKTDKGWIFGKSNIPTQNSL